MRREYFIPILILILMLLSPQLAMLEPSEETDDAGAKSSACSGTLCLSELFVNAVGSETDAVGPSDWTTGEWVEIHNSGTSSVDMTGWYLRDHYGNSNRQLDFSISSSPATVVWPQNAQNLIIAAGGYMVIARNGDGGSCGFCMTNGQGVVELYDSTGTQVHEATWSTSVSQGASLIESSSSPTSDWQPANSLTPGQANSGGGSSTGPTWNTSDLRISELLADAWPSADNSTFPGGEWVEIENTGITTISLAGWSVKDLTGNTLNINDTHLVDYATSDSIDPGEYRVVAINGFKSYGVFNNGGDSAFLVNPAGEYVSAANYSSNGEIGHSFVAPAIGTGSWTNALFPTPGEANALSVNGSSLVRINEVLVNATNSGQAYPEGEWIEFSHRGENPSIDVAGWRIVTGTGQSASLDSGFADRDAGAGSIIEAGSYVVLPIPATAELFVNGDTVSLLDSTGVIVDSVSWSANPGDNKTVVPTDPDLPSQNLMTSSWSTPATANPNQIGSSVNESAEFRISEIMPDPIGSDSNHYPEGEWVEIVNVGNNTTSFQGWKIRAEGGGSLTLNSLTIPGMNESDPSEWELGPGEYLAVWKNATSMTMRNSGSVISLVNPSGEITQTLTYALTPENATLVEGFDESGNWVPSPYPTPGEENPSFEDPYTGSTQLVVSEIMPQCVEGNMGIEGDWLEIHNPTNSPINISRWMIGSHNQDESLDHVLVLRDTYLRHYSAGVAYEPTDWWNLGAGEYAVIIPENNALLSNYDEVIDLRDPNGDIRQEIIWTSSENCRSMEGDASAWSEPWLNTMWPSPGEENPTPTPWDEEDPVWFTRIMPGQVHNRDNEFIEITNMGNSILNLAGWQLVRTKNDGTTNSALFNTLILQPGEAIVLSQAAGNLSEDGGIDAVDMDDVMDYTLWMYDSGSSMQLVSPGGIVADTVVYGDGTTNVDGWSGPSITTPPASFQGLIFMRGDGCNLMNDTNTSADWEMRWIRLGASLFCDSGVFSTSGSLEPMASPDGALYQFMEWLDSTNTELHIHTYELMSEDIIEKLIQLSQADVNVTVIVEENPVEESEDLLKVRGMAYEMHAAGINVHWMGTPRGEDAPPAPYQYIHSKVAVRDDNSVWIGSGNVKTSTFPPSNWSSNRDWGLIINSEDVAQLFLTRMLWDENTSHKHLIEYDPNDPETGKPIGWTSYGPTGLDPIPPTEPIPIITGDFSGQVFTCPDDCISGIISLLDSADTSIELSLQGFDMDWHWGFGDENPLVGAIERALQRGVAVRLLINGYYVSYSSDIREVVNHFNNQWNRTDGYDATAILMSPAERIVKLHNKGVIVDGESVLISSINWNSNAILRNREMGVVIHNSDLAQWYLNSFEDDWNRVDDVTDTDGDNMPDKWEIAHGLNRTSSIVPGSPIPEQSHDFDGDGLDNLREMNVSADPNNADTDGDCLNDLDELMFATLTGISSSDAIHFTDADSDGIPDGEETECGASLAGNGEGGGDGEDNVTTTGPQIPEADDPLDSTAARVLLGIVGVAMVLLVIALIAVLLGGREHATGVVTDKLLDSASTAQEMAFDADNIEDAEAPIDTAPTDAPILDGSGSDEPKILSSRDNTIGRHDGVHGAPLLDGFQFGEWTPQQVQDALNSGWTVEQLREYYDNENQ
ncbi:MAG TPA: lamin tail domain-containing protein [Candidatus Thalassarchaeaceae archaeon]|nr:lamin tail domain-containing protein [Candidatus Thalassarchaeaceae archaeon]